eukprot:TRINITY_DN52119_c0_g1_i1.p1 TRINITY_DN52119_c0_g1~~TRINITY_DN52119_c0_g1_i1.p1  ORF type:complete len:133 (+),score=50.37 TRINITY_DN52119_c0_g1_i1:133-531(+)
MLRSLVGSEMCIRDRVMEEMLFTMYDSWAHTSEEIMGRPPLSKIRHYIKDMYYVTAVNFEEALLHDGPGADLMLFGFLIKFCLLYTSDAADEEDSVDLGGRRIIKKKKIKHNYMIKQEDKIDHDTNIVKRRS